MSISTNRTRGFERFSRPHSRRNARRYRHESSKEEYEETCSRLERANAKQTHLESVSEQAIKVLQSTRDQQRRFGEEFEK